MVSLQEKMKNIRLHWITYQALWIQGKTNLALVWSRRISGIIMVRKPSNERYLHIDLLFHCKKCSCNFCKREQCHTNTTDWKNMPYRCKRYNNRCHHSGSLSWHNRQIWEENRPIISVLKQYNTIKYTSQQYLETIRLLYYSTKYSHI
jgi:hypothetical protein